MISLEIILALTFWNALGYGILSTIQNKNNQIDDLKLKIACMQRPGFGFIQWDVEVDASISKDDNGN